MNCRNAAAGAKVIGSTVTSELRGEPYYPLVQWGIQLGHLPAAG